MGTSRTMNLSPIDIHVNKSKMYENEHLQTELDEDNTNVIKLEFTDKIDGYNTRNIGSNK